MINQMHICFHADIEDLVATYVGVNFLHDIVLVIYNPANYKDMLFELGLFFDETKINFDRVMVVQLDSIEDGIEMLNLIKPDIGPICSLWVDGKRVIDNIEENL